jgi:murein DD-endopeptidase MepM/ murein hydrolase activator NlpD
MDHGHGLSSTFLHLDKILVEEGQHVKQGEVVALMGKSGRVTGPHLDWRMNWRDERIDPALLVPPMPKSE